MAEKEKTEKGNGESAEAPVASASMVVAEREELPKTIVRRLVKEKLSQLSKGSDISVLRDALQAFSESARIFIHYLSATANDVCKESKRQIISAEDVFKALEEIDFAEFVGPLRASLEELRKKNAAKKSGSPKESNQKGKRKEPPVADEEDNEDGSDSDEEPRQKNAGKKSAGSTKKSNRKDTRKQQPVTDEEDEDGSDEVEDSSASD